jgi:hypothetical protein
MSHGMLERQQTSVLNSLFSNEMIVIKGTLHYLEMLWSANNARKVERGDILTSKASFANTRPGINHEWLIGHEERATSGLVMKKGATSGW